VLSENTENDEKKKQMEEEKRKEMEEEKRKAEEMLIQITPEDIINERIKILPLDLKLLRYGLSNPGLAPDGQSMVYLRLSLENIGLSDIDVLKNYKYIQQLELSGNSISDISVLGNMRYLTKLDLSNNNITKLLDFKPHPFNLQEIDFSRNKIEKIDNLSDHRFLKKVCLDKNLISVIEGFDECKYLTHLSLSHNFITRIENLYDLPLVYLDLSWNNITHIQNITSLEKLSYLDISHNKLSGLCGLQKSYYLSNLNVSYNNITNLEEIKYIMDLPFLTDLFMHHNSVINEKDFRLKVIFNLPTLKILDGILITEIEKVSSQNTFQPPGFVINSISQINNFYKSILLNANLHSPDKLYVDNICLIILCSNPSCGKQKYINKLVEEYPNVVGTPIIYTTDQDLCKSIDSNYYYVGVNTMKDMIQENKFIQITGSSGKYFGITYDSVNEIRRSGRICIISLNIEGVKNITTSNMNYVILFITRQQDAIVSNASSIYINNNSTDNATSSGYTYSYSSQDYTNSSGEISNSQATTSKDYTYSTTISDSINNFSSNTNDYNDYSNSYTINSSDFTQEPSTTNQSSNKTSSTNYSSTTTFLQNDNDPSFTNDTITNSGGNSSSYQFDNSNTSSSYTYSNSNSNSNSNTNSYSYSNSNSNSNSNSYSNNSSELNSNSYTTSDSNINSNSKSNNSSNSDNDAYIYYNLSSSSNNINSDCNNINNILASVMTESLFLNSDGYSMVDNSNNYFSHLIKPVRILDSKCSSRNGRRPSKFEPYFTNSNMPPEEKEKYSKVENLCITELQEWLSNSRIGTDLSSDIFNYIILNEGFNSTYYKLKKWIVSLYWSAYDAQEVDNRVKEMKLLEEEINYLKS